ncbi:MAG: DnaJ domain-containing protein [Pseudanabaenaceae cyanobacterium]
MGRSPECFRIGKGLGQYTTNDYFAALGVPLTADSGQIRQRYTTLAKRLHPDVCRQEADRACQYFAKLVSPAYAAIWPAKERGEYQTLMRLIGKQLIKKNQPIVPVFPTTQRYIAMPTLPNYERLVQDLAASQYISLERVMPVAEQLSELNLFYILFTEGYVPPEPSRPSADSPPPVQSTPVLSLEAALAEVEGYMQAQAWDKALNLLRQLLPQHNHSSQVHALLGLVYLQKKVLGMAKVSFQQALKLDSRNEIALKNLEKLQQQDRDRRKNKQGFFGWLGKDS